MDVEKKKKTRRGKSKKVARQSEDDPAAQDETMDAEVSIENINNIASSSASPPADNDAETPPLQSNFPEGEDENEDALMIEDDDTSNTIPIPLPLSNPDGTSVPAPSFAPLSAAAQQAALGPRKSDIRRIPIPPHRMAPLKKEWVSIFGPLTELLGLQVRMNVQRRCVEMRVRICLSLIWSYVDDAFRLVC